MVKPAFHGQNAEDFVLWEFFDRRTEGFYVDIGAFDGVYMSNSCVFEQMGWNGICIEPIPGYAALCERNRPGAICLALACLGEDSLSETEFRYEELGIVSGITAHEDDPGLQNTYKAFGQVFKGFEKITVPASTLNHILEQYLPSGRQLDFLSLDVEGFEIEVLSGFDIQKYKPKAIVVEANSEEDLAILVNYFVREEDYVLARKHAWNYYFVRSDQDVLKMSSIQVDCRVEPQIHPLGARASLPARNIRQQ